MEDKRKSEENPLRFIFSELTIFASQIVVFFTIAFLSTNCLSSKNKLLDLINSKVLTTSFEDVGYFIVGTLFVVGIFTAVGRAVENSNIEKFIDEILREIPRTFYVFGSATSGIMFATSLYLYNNPEEKASAVGFFSITTVFVVITFFYGCSLSYVFRRKPKR